MPKVKSLEDLLKIKEKALKGMKTRETGKRGKITVAMGTCGIAAGAKETLRAIIDELDRRGVDDVVVVQSGCMGLCEYEPTVKVEIEGLDPVVYGPVKPEDVPRIVQSHILEKTIVEDLVVKRGEV